MSELEKAAIAYVEASRLLQGLERADADGYSVPDGEYIRAVESAARAWSALELLVPWHDASKTLTQSFEALALLAGDRWDGVDANAHVRGLRGKEGER